MSTSRDNSQLFEFFLSTLETHQNLLHAETQAIAAKHLDTIESILAKKEEMVSEGSKDAEILSREGRGIEPKVIPKRGAPGEDCISQERTRGTKNIGEER